MSVQRTRIADAVADAPGIHFSGLVRRLDLASGQVQYHLGRLRDRGGSPRNGSTAEPTTTRLSTTSGSGGPSRSSRGRRPGTWSHTSSPRGPSSPSSVAERLDVARSTVEWHVDRIAGGDLVQKHRDGRGRVTLVAARPAETMALLAVVEPSPAGRMVDRFERLVDSMLSG